MIDQRPYLSTETDIDLADDLSDKELLRLIARSLLTIERRSAISREVPKVLLPVIPIFSSSDAGPVTTVNQKWNVPVSFKVEKYHIWSDTATWFTLMIGPTRMGPYRVAAGYTEMPIEDFILAGNEIQIVDILTATSQVRLQVQGAYQE